MCFVITTFKDTVFEKHVLFYCKCVLFILYTVREEEEDKRVKREKKNRKSIMLSFNKMIEKTLNSYMLYCSVKGHFLSHSE